MAYINNLEKQILTDDEKSKDKESTKLKNIFSRRFDIKNSMEFGSSSLEENIKKIEQDIKDNKTCFNDCLSDCIKLEEQIKKQGELSEQESAAINKKIDEILILAEELTLKDIQLKKDLAEIYEKDTEMLIKTLEAVGSEKTPSA